MATARAALESLLRDRKLDITLTTARPWVAEDRVAADRVAEDRVAEDRVAEDRVAATGIPGIDVPLGGGIGRGQLSEITGPRSAGRTTVLCRMLAAATARGEVVALVDTCDRFDPVSAEGAGADLSRLLWIRERGDAPRALKALNLVVQAGGFGLVAFDLADVPSPLVRQFPYTTWMRIARVIEGSQAAVVLLGAEHIARSPRGATVALDRREGAVHGIWSGAGDRARVLAAIEVAPRVIAARTGLTADS